MIEEQSEATPKEVIYDVDGHVVRITLNRPDKLNAFTRGMLNELDRALSRAEQDGTVRAVVLAGAGRGFSAGQDVHELHQINEAHAQVDLMEHLEQGIHPVIRRMRGMEKPIIGAIHGVAAGAGASLAFACDLRVASEDARFIQAFVNVGLIPDAGATFFLPRLVGLGRALELAFTGRPVDAETAERIGLVNQIVPAERLMEIAMDVARRLADGPTTAIGLTKRAMNRSLLLDLDQALSYEGELQNIACCSADYRERIAAFVEKRKSRAQGSERALTK